MNLVARPLVAGDVDPADPHPRPARDRDPEHDVARPPLPAPRARRPRRPGIPRAAKAVGHAGCRGRSLRRVEEGLAQQAGRQLLERRAGVRQRVPLEHHAGDHEAGPLDDLEAHVGDAAVGVAA